MLIRRGKYFTFEKGADVWLDERFGWECKGKHKDLRAAYQQLLKYRESLNNPPLTRPILNNESRNRIQITICRNDGAAAQRHRNRRDHYVDALDHPTGATQFGSKLTVPFRGLNGQWPEDQVGECTKEQKVPF